MKTHIVSHTMKFISYYTFVLIVVLCLFPQSLAAQGWRVWSTTPVFDQGRAMPLSSFAQQIVKEICGSSRPYIVPDDTILQELNKVVEYTPRLQVADNDPVLYMPSPNGSADTGFLSETNQIRRFREESVLKIRHLDRTQAAQIIQRIKTILPDNGRYFEASELLLSWFVEPEIWNYIPIFPISDNEYRNNILNIPDRNTARTRLKRAAVFQLEQSQTFNRRLQTIRQKRLQPEGRDVLAADDIVTERLAQQMSVFQSLTFHPERHYPDRMVTLLRQSGSISDEHASSCGNGFEVWNYLLGLGDEPSSRPMEASGLGRKDHPTTIRWQAISRKIAQLAEAFERTDSNGNMLVPNLKKVERQFELLLDAIDANIQESIALIERCYPQSDFRNGLTKPSDAPKIETLLPQLFAPQNEQKNTEAICRLALSYHYSLKQLRRETEAAYLALYDNGRTLRVLPVISAQTIGDPELNQGVQPWGSMCMVLHGGDSFVRRFLDANFMETETGKSTVLKATPGENKETTNAKQVTESLLLSIPLLLPETPDEEAPNKPPTAETTETKTEDQVAVTDPHLQEEDESYEIDLFDDENASDAVNVKQKAFYSTSVRPPLNDSIRWARIYFERTRADYFSVGREGSTELFTEAMARFRESLAVAAKHINIVMEGLVEKDNELSREMFVKTAYSGSTIVIGLEYRYFRIAPFFWMWVFAALGIVLIVISLCIGVFRRDMIDAELPPDINTAYDVGQNSQRDQEEKGDISWVLTDEGRGEKMDFTQSAEEYLLWLGIGMIGLSIFITLIGALMRSCISGWAPVTNMYETIVLMALSTMILGLWYALYPIVHPAMKLAWKCSNFPKVSKLLSSLASAPKTAPKTGETEGEYAMRQAAEEFGVPNAYAARSASPPDAFETSAEQHHEPRRTATDFWQVALLLPRIFLMMLTFLFVVSISYGEYADEHGIFAAALRMLSMHDPIDWFVVVLSIGLIVWFVPRLILAAAVFFPLLLRPNRIATYLGVVSFTEEVAPMPIRPSRQRSELGAVLNGETAMASPKIVENSGTVWLNRARNQILERKWILIVAATVTLIAGVCAQFNSTEFNPNIRPIVAVLRSNFWLTVHVVTIVVGYAAALIAWGMAAVALGVIIFGQYRRFNNIGGHRHVLPPVSCDLLVSNIVRLVRLALVLLTLGTVLGARWADYSWGRFWSWDPKEVWALVTILFFATVLHGRIAKYLGQIGVMIGALFGSIAVIITWYAINFLMKGSVHAYGGNPAGSAIVFLWTFISLNVLWGIMAIFRYNLETYGVDEDNSLPTDLY